jgi:Transcriptional regulator
MYKVEHVFKDAGGSISRRERHVQERRREILAAALELVESKGYLSTSMEEIAEKADVARGTLYNHFESKADVVMALVETVSKEWLEKGARKLQRGGSNTAAIRDILTAAAEWFDVHPQTAIGFFHALRERIAPPKTASKVNTLVPRDLVEKAQKEGELTDELHVDVLVHMIEAALRNQLIKLMQGSARGRIAPHVKRDSEIIMRKLAP